MAALKSQVYNILPCQGPTHPQTSPFAGSTPKSPGNFPKLRIGNPMSRLNLLPSHFMAVEIVLHGPQTTQRLPIDTGMHLNFILWTSLYCQYLIAPPLILLFGKHLARGNTKLATNQIPMRESPQANYTEMHYQD